MIMGRVTSCGRHSLTRSLIFTMSFACLWFTLVSGMEAHKGTSIGSEARIFKHHHFGFLLDSAVCQILTAMQKEQSFPWKKICLLQPLCGFLCMLLNQCGKIKNTGNVLSTIVRVAPWACAWALKEMALTICRTAHPPTTSSYSHSFVSHCICYPTRYYSCLRFSSLN